MSGMNMDKVMEIRAPVVLTSIRVVTPTAEGTGLKGTRTGGRTDEGEMLVVEVKEICVGVKEAAKVKRR